MDVKQIIQPLAGTTLIKHKHYFCSHIRLFFSNSAESIGLEIVKEVIVFLYCLCVNQNVLSPGERTEDAYLFSRL